VLAQRIPVVAGVDWDAAYTPPISMFAVGIMPAISAFLLVEVASLLFRRWRALRSGGPSARARLGSATAILTVLIALAQSWMLAHYLRSFPPLAHLSQLGLVASLTGGALVMTFVALLISRYGLGNGFAVLFLASQGAMAYRLIDGLAEGSTDLLWLLPVLVAVTASALATSWILRTRVRGPSAASSIRLPTAGVVPLLLLPSLLALLAHSWPEAAARIGVWWQDTVMRPGSGVLAALLFVTVLGLALSWLFSRPSLIGDARVRGSRPKSFLVAVAVSIAYLALLVLLADWAGQVVVGLSSVALTTAVVMDLVAEWRALARRDDLVPIWPLHQVQRVDLVTAALARNGIGVHTRGLYFRLLLHFFGPFVPVLLHVPRDQAEEARAIVRAQIEPK
jgi:hypothetical protein